MTTTVLSPLLVQRFVDNSGAPLVGGKLFTYVAGSTTPQATYTDSTGNTSNVNPIVLNARGECNCWVPPNVAYKFVLTDASGNVLDTVDNVIQAQLLSLYAGVDSGTANNYIVTYSASYQSYQQGTVLFFLPSNSNTGPSTLNVNSLGVVNILNANGSALTAGQIVAGQMVQVIYTNGNFILTSIGALSGTGIGTFGTEVSLASATTTDLGSTGSHVINVTGSSTIGSFGTSASTTAPIYIVRFSGALTINQSSAIVTPTGQAISVNVGDAAVLEYMGSGNWRILLYQAAVASTVTAVKTTPTSRATNTTLTADPALTLALSTGTYALSGWINDVGGTSAGGLNGTFVFSGTTASANWAMNGNGGGVTAVGLNAISAVGTAQQMQSAQSGTGNMVINGYLQVTSPGTLTFTWSQHSSNATATIVGQGSWIAATLLAASSGGNLPFTRAYNTPGSAVESIPAGYTTLTIEDFGGSGGGNIASPIGNGGGAGGYAKSTYTVTGAGGQTINYTVGSAGSTGGNGTASTVSSGTFAVTTMTANGGNGATAGSGGNGGTASGGNVTNTTGTNGATYPPTATGGAGITGTYGTGSSGGNGAAFSPGNPGGPGLVIFHYA